MRIHPKSILKTLFIGLFSFFYLSNSANAQGYEINVQIKGFPDTIAYLSYFYGAGQFYRDTASVDADGKFSFVNEKDTLEHGMYSVILENKKLSSVFRKYRKCCSKYISTSLNVLA